MSINIKATNIELTRAINNYVNKRIELIRKFVGKDQDFNVYVEVGKTTNHHKQGDYFKAEFNIDINGEHFFTDSEKNDLYRAIDDAKNELIKKIKNNKNKKETLFKRGSIRVKRMMKGISRINPFTSK